MTTQHIRLLQEFYTESNSFYISYKREQDRILYFAGTIFISVIALTGIFGAIGQQNIVYNFRWYHLLIFHTIFFILYLFYTYKMLCAEVYLIIGLEVELAIQKILKLSNQQTIHLTSLKNKFLGDSLRIKPLKRGLNPGKLANILVFSLYFFTSLGPYVILQADLTQKNRVSYTLDSNIWTLVITSIFFTVFVIVDRRLHKRRKEIRGNVRDDITTRLDRFLVANIEIK